jgi:thymidine kinase
MTKIEAKGNLRRCIYVDQAQIFVRSILFSLHKVGRNHVVHVMCALSTYTLQY